MTTKEPKPFLPFFGGLRSWWLVLVLWLNMLKAERSIIWQMHRKTAILEMWHPNLNLFNLNKSGQYHVRWSLLLPYYTSGELTSWFFFLCPNEFSLPKWKSHKSPSTPSDKSRYQRSFKAKNIGNCCYPDGNRKRNFLLQELFPSLGGLGLLS